MIGCGPTRIQVGRPFIVDIGQEPSQWESQS